MIVYYCGEFIEKSKVVVSPDDRGFLFADGIYEVIRSYQGRLFKFAEHADRLAFGLNELKIHGFEPQTLEPLAMRLLEENGLENGDSTLYLQITRGVAPRSHLFPAAGTPPTVYLEAKPFTPPLAAQQSGVPAIIVPDQRWARCDLKTVGLLANTLAAQRAHEAGAFEAIFSRDGVLLEGSHSSMLFVKDNVLIFPPLTNYVLGSITRNVLFSLASQESIPTATRPCHEHELAGFQEIVMAGTGVEIVPVVSVGGINIGAGVPGPITRKLQRAFRELTGTP